MSYSGSGGDKPSNRLQIRQYSLNKATMITNMTAKKLTLWVCLLIHKIAGLHASHLQYSSFDPGHECSNLDILVEDIFL